MFGNGYVLGAFVGPLEMPEKLIYKVHHKLSRLWMGYSTPLNLGVGLAPVLTDTQTGKQRAVGGANDYRYEDGVITMETELPIGTVTIETYGLWQKPVFVRRFRFTSKNGESARYTISTTSLFAEHSNAKPDESDKEAMHFYNAYPEERERLVSYTFPADEKLTYANGHVYWTYADNRYRKVAVMAAEPMAEMMLTQSHEATKESGELCGLVTLCEKKSVSLSGTDWGGVRLENSGETLTVIMAFVVDNCWESDILGEYSLMNALSIVGFEQAYRTSVALGDPQPLWHQRSQELEKAFNKHLVRYDEDGEPYILK